MWPHPSPHTGQSVDPMPWSSLIERMLLPCLMMVNDPWLQILHSSWPKLIDYDRISHQVWFGCCGRHMVELKESSTSLSSSRFEFPPIPPFSYIRWSYPFLFFPPVFIKLYSKEFPVWCLWKFRWTVLCLVDSKYIAEKEYCLL